MRFGRNVPAAEVEGGLSRRAAPVTMAGVDGSESTHIAPPPPAATGRRPSGRTLSVIGAVWIALAGGALGVARVMDDEPVAQVVLVAKSPQGLPVLGLFLDRELPKDVAAMTSGAEQAARLQQLANEGQRAAPWVDLGAFAQRAGDLTFAKDAYSRALAIDPDRVDAKVGLLMVDGATGPDGLTRAAAGLIALEDANPDSQLVLFNTGMVAIYRGDRAEVVRAFTRAARLGPSTPLGRLARRFAAASDETPKVP